MCTKPRNYAIFLFSSAAILAGSTFASGRACLTFARNLLWYFRWRKRVFARGKRVSGSVKDLVFIGKEEKFCGDSGRGNTGIAYPVRLTKRFSYLGDAEVIVPSII